MDAKDDALSAWENVDFSLHQLTHILKGAACVSESADPIDETIDTLIHLALDQIEKTQEHLWTLRKQSALAHAPRPEDGATAH